MQEVLRRSDQDGGWGKVSGRRRRGAAAALIALLAGALAACGGTGGPTVSQSPGTMSDEQIMAIVREHGECVRSHGVPDFVDPTLENGRLKGGGPPEGADDTTVDAAMLACKEIWARLPATVVQGDPPPTAAEIEGMRRFSACVREHGIPDWPDPSADGIFPIRNTPLETALKTDQGQVAVKACKQHYEGPIRVGGAGGGK